MTRPPTSEEFSAWLEGYKRAWESRNRDTVGALFTEGATYKDSRFYPAIEGRANIIDFWRERIVTREVIAFSYEVMGSFEGMGLCRWQTSLLDFSDHENLKYEGQSAVMLCRFHDAERVESLEEWREVTPIDKPD